MKIKVALTSLALMGVGYSQNPSPERSNRAIAVSLKLTQALPMPEPKADGRGEPLERLVPGYAADFENDAYLKNDVTSFRRWEWTKLYNSLNKKNQEQPNNLNIYRVQIEAYLINQQYREALSQADQILRRAPTDLHALASSVLAARILNMKTLEEERMGALKGISALAANDLQKVLNLVEANFSKKRRLGVDS